jgi:imidazole glycerol-phosphate synthase subunit HisH
MITIVDYGMGNLDSVAKAALKLGAGIKVTDSASIIKKSSKIILPGVGNFGQAVSELKKRKLYYLLIEKINQGIPFVGICVGMQLLFEASQEAPGVKGLGAIAGEVKKFRLKNLVVPHMGWNQVKLTTNDQRLTTKKLFKGIPDKSYFYFAHSYYCCPDDPNDILATTDYGIEFAGAVNKGNVWGVQFHPEKSQKYGLKLFSNLLKI